MSAIVRLEPGVIFATDFRVVAPLSEGGMGTVYVVDQISTGARRALKLMHPQLVADETLRRRFEQEARISARIESDHVIHVVGAGVDAASGTPWLAMELLTGTDLAAHVEATGPVAPEMMLLIFEQLCHALAAAHRMGVVHRDLKPENLYLSKPRSTGATFTLKVLDFGIAKIAVETTASHTAAVGTPMWMAPEQTSPGQPVTPQTDIWALGLIAFWLLTGRSFWRAGNVDAPTMPMFLREILIDDLPSASARAAAMGSDVALGPEFDRWFARCVHRDQKARYSTASAAYEELVRVFSKDGIARAAARASVGSAWAHSTEDIRVSSSSRQVAMTAAPVTSPPAPSDSRGPVAMRRRSFRVGLGASAAVAAGALGLFLAWRSVPKAMPPLSSPQGSPLAAAAEASAAAAAAATADTVMLPPQAVGGSAPGDLGAAPSASAPSASAASSATSPAEPSPAAAAESSSIRLPARARDVAAAPRGTVSEPHGDSHQAFADINKVVRAHLSSVKHQCWEPAIAGRSPDSPSNARVIVSLNISPDGTVQSAEARGGDGFSGLAGCVQSQAMKLRFPPSNGGAIVSVPFVFAAQ